MTSLPLVLTGLPGSGKSTVAQAFGRSAGRPVFVMDELLEAEAGTTIARIFADRGEAYFRQQEAALLRQLLSDH
ncbi:MAG: shikimate kinase, partial [Actinomycetota bacterium]